MTTEVTYYPAPESLFQAAAAYIIKLINRKKDNPFTIALSGGSTPAGLYKKIAELNTRQHTDWNNVHFFWSDERFVPHHHRQSNYQTAALYLFPSLNLPAANIHPIPVNCPTPAACAENYHNEIITFFNERPVFDLILLGIGHDGHTASLFPGDRAGTASLVKAVSRPKVKPQVARITMTYDLLQQAHTILFLVTGKTKKTVTEKIISQGLKTAHLYPAAAVKAGKKIKWMITYNNE
ncbi:MAG TPA: 6-phosphogluconolactonase [Spirochaetota bacterium]|nr:6-phosphogluconolactonase [Spirochaetota bacterium]